MTKAFDSALFIPPSPNAGEVVEIASPGPPLKTQFNTYIGGPPGVTVDASVPAATAQGQSLLSGPGPGFDWESVASSSVLPIPTGPGQTYVSAFGSPYPMQLTPATPQASAAYQVMVSGPSGSFPWMVASIPTLMTLGNAVTTINGGTFIDGANLVFTPSAGFTTRMDGTDPSASAIDNFTIDAGTF
jgi:hypothetical protein